jgi:hypothetical protein
MTEPTRLVWPILLTRISGQVWLNSIENTEQFCSDIHLGELHHEENFFRSVRNQ